MKPAFRSAAVAAVLVAAACVDSSTPTAPRYLEPEALAATGATLIGAPDLNDPRSFEGQLFVCKDGSPTGVNFDFDYEIRNTLNNTVVASGTTTVPVGSCALAATVPTNVSGRFEATVTEQAPPAFWTLTNITYAYGVGINPPAPTIDLATRTISALRMSNDAGVMTVFTNTFDPPVGEIGDFVWDDLNQNGVQDSGEPGIAGVGVTLSGAAGGSTTTDANGFYLFSGLGAGSYVVTVGTPSGYTPSPSNQGGDPNLDSNGSPAAVTLATNSSIDHSIDFGFYVTPVGCTLTQGYWKTHPQDWDSAADGHLFTTTSTFYNSGKSYYDIMWTNPSGGNAYIQLAHQFIAASLNLDGASSGIAAVDAAMAGAAAYFPTAPAGIPKPSGALRTQLQGWATTLDNFNNGLLGVPHC